MQYYIENWRKITSDENILDIVQHCHFEFDEDFSDCQFHVFQGGKFTESESIAIDNEISSLLAMNVITEVDHNLRVKLFLLFSLFQRRMENIE